MPKRIQLSRKKGYRKPEGAVVVSRPSRWGNPFKIEIGDDPEAAVFWFRLLVSRIDSEFWSWSPRDGVFIKTVDIKRELAGRDLACWCKLCEQHRDGKPLGVDCNDCDPCHADVLLAIGNR